MHFLGGGFTSYIQVAVELWVFFPNGTNRNFLEENLVADMQHSKTCFWSSCSARHRCGETTSFMWVGAELPPFRQFQGFTAMGLYGFHLWWCGQVLRECFALLQLLGIMQGLARLLHDFCKCCYICELWLLGCFSVVGHREPISVFQVNRRTANLKLDQPYLLRGFLCLGFYSNGNNHSPHLSAEYMCVYICVLCKTGRAVPTFFFLEIDLEGRRCVGYQLSRAIAAN